MVELYSRKSRAIAAKGIAPVKMNTKHELARVSKGDRPSSCYFLPHNPEAVVYLHSYDCDDYWGGNSPWKGFATS